MVNQSPERPGPVSIFKLKWDNPAAPTTSSVDPTVPINDVFTMKAAKVRLPKKHKPADEPKPMDGDVITDDIMHAAAQLLDEAGKLNGSWLEDDLASIIEADMADTGEKLATDHEGSIIKKATAGLGDEKEKQLYHNSAALVLDGHAAEVEPEMLQEAVINGLIGNFDISSSHPTASASGPAWSPPECFGQWHEASQAAAMILRYREESLREKPLGHKGEMSLVTQAASKVVLVSWTHAPSMTGRIVRLDAHQRPIWAIPGMTDVVDFRGCEIVHPAIGVRLQKVAGPSPSRSFTKSGKPVENLRPVIKDDILKLKHMWEVALDLKNKVAESVLPCIACGLEIEDESTFTCPLCLLPWHSICGERLSVKMAEAIMRMPASELAAIPAGFYADPNSAQCAPSVTCCGCCCAWLKPLL